MATGLANMTKEEKDEMVQKKWEDMKRKNEEILKRHLQIEADKKNADMYSKAVIERKKNNPAPPEVPKEKRVSNRQNSKQLIMRRDSRETEEKRKQRLSDGDAPPPDPNFNFLSDPLRKNEEFERTDTEAKEQGFRHKNNFGGEDFQNVKTSIKQQRNYTKEHPMSPPKNKMEMTGKERRDYENWRKEREEIDKERIARQKTSEGTFKREWDNNKIIPDPNEITERKPNEYYKNVQWSKDGDKSGRFRGRDSQFSSPEWDEDENAKQNRFSRTDSRRSFGDKHPNGDFEGHSEKATKPPLYPGWEPKRNVDNFVKKAENQDGRIGRRSDAPSWRAGERSDSFHSKGGRGRGHRNFNHGANTSSSIDDGSWREVKQDDITWRDVKQDDVAWRDVNQDGVAWRDVKQDDIEWRDVKDNDDAWRNSKQVEGSWKISKQSDCTWKNSKQDNSALKNLKQDDGAWKNSKQDDVTWRDVKQDDIEWDIDPHDQGYINNCKKDNLEDLNIEEEIDLASMTNIVIQCKGENRKVQVEHGLTHVEQQEESQEGEDDWEDISSEEEKVEIGRKKKNKMAYENLRMSVNNEVCK